MANLKRSLKDLGIALLNATLMLAIILCILVLLVLNRASHTISRVEQLSMMPSEIVDTLENDPLLDEIDRLSGALASVTASLDTEIGEEISGEIALLKQQLGSLVEKLEDAASQCAVDIEHVMNTTLEALIKGGVSSPIDTVSPRQGQPD